jgi:limonene-1,2-epoxide hydrolase
MTTTLDIVKKYYSSWVGKDFSSAVALLSPHLTIEVPINRYPNRESFMKAVEITGSLVVRIKLLGEFTNGGEAMLLYDMELKGLGNLRVAEYFEVVGGFITLIRQIHDTYALRNAGFSKETTA